RYSFGVPCALKVRGRQVSEQPFFGPLRSAVDEPQAAVERTGHVSSTSTGTARIQSRLRSRVWPISRARGRRQGQESRRRLREDRFVVRSTGSDTREISIRV